MMSTSDTNDTSDTSDTSQAMMTVAIVEFALPGRRLTD